MPTLGEMLQGFLSSPQVQAFKNRAQVTPQNMPGVFGLPAGPQPAGLPAGFDRTWLRPYSSHAGRGVAVNVNGTWMIPNPAYKYGSVVQKGQTAQPPMIAAPGRLYAGHYITDDGKVYQVGSTNKMPYTPGPSTVPPTGGGVGTGGGIVGQPPPAPGPAPAPAPGYIGAPPSGGAIVNTPVNPALGPTIAATPPLVPAAVDASGGVLQPAPGQYGGPAQNVGGVYPDPTVISGAFFPPVPPDVTSDLQTQPGRMGGPAILSMLGY